MGKVASILKTATVLLGLALTVSIWLPAQVALSPLAEAAPEEVGAPLREALSPGGWVFSRDGVEQARFWFVRELPPQAGMGPLGVNFSSLKSSQLVGVVQLPAEWSDYKDKPVSPGIYTLRYALQPADGNHTGVSSYRDFLLLLPASEDADPTVVHENAQLNRLSAKASGTNHPAALALFPIWDGVDKTSLVKNELDQLTLAVKIGDQTLGLVLQGHGEIEGY